MSGSKSLARSAASPTSKILVTLACLLLVAAVLWQLLPKAAFSSDLGQVGQERPALVMLREIHVMGGDRVMEQMQQIYPDYQDEVAFLVVHTGHPDGQMFASTHNVTDGSLVLFDARGIPLATLGRPADAAELRGFLNQHLASD